MAVLFSPFWIEHMRPCGEHGLLEVRKEPPIDAGPQLTILKNGQWFQIIDSPSRLFKHLPPKSLLDRFVRLDPSAGKNVNARGISDYQDLLVLAENHGPRRGKPGLNRKRVD